VVGFDTTILPGREGSITEEVAMSKVHDGAFTKCATVTSNARNKTDLRLCLKGFVKVPVAVSPQYISMKKSASGDYECEVTLSTDKPDLQVKGITFSTNASASSGQSAWQEKLPIYVEFKLTKPEKPKDGGVFDYKLAIFIKADFPQNQFGDFTITTNHPEAAELKENGMIDVGPKK
jgi:hypothetical protein